MPLAKSILIPLGLTAATSAVDAEIYKKILGSIAPGFATSGSGTTALKISNEKMRDLMKIVKPLEYSGLLIKVSTQAIQIETKEQRGGFIVMLLGTLSASLLENMLTDKEVIRVGNEVIRAGLSLKCRLIL